MKHIKYLNALLTIIAACLVLITLAVTGVITTANANATNRNSVLVPVNPDGSITVRFAPTETLNVNVDEVGGRSTRGTINVNIAEVFGTSHAGSIPVTIK